MYWKKLMWLKKFSLNLNDGEKQGQQSVVKQTD